MAIALVGSATGEATKVYLFVVCLPFSWLFYVEPTLGVKKDTWRRCRVHAFACFGGAVPCIVPDNPKCGFEYLRFNGEHRVMRSSSERVPHYVYAGVSRCESGCSLLTAA